MQVKSKKAAFERSSSTKKNIRFEDDLLNRINVVAGEGKFSLWVKEACIEKLERLENTKENK